MDPVDKPTLVEMLHDASELEHALCCQYLYAAWSLKRGGEGGVGATAAALNAQWGQQITKIAVQEMYHLLLASNLLTALGEEPHLQRRNFPQLASRYSKIGLPSMLAPFSTDTVGRFICWERPDRVGWWDEQCRARAQMQATALGVDVEAAGPPPPFSSIGELYTLIENTIVANPDWIDPATANRQVTSEIVPFSPKVAAITTAADARRYVDIIVTEGEGAPDWTSFSHFAYFHQVAQTLESVGGGGSFGWATVLNPIYDLEHDAPGASPIEDAGVNAVGRLFSSLYLVMLRTLSRLFIPEGELPAQRQSLANAAMAIMPLALKPLGELLCRLPAGAPYTGAFAGPSFELPAVIEPPRGAHTDALPDLAAELRAVALRARSLEDEASPDVGATLGLIAARLETVAPLYEPMEALV